MEEDIKELKILFYSDRLTAYGKRKLIKYYEQQIQNLREIEESHRKENGELREKVKQLEEENKTLNEKNQYLVKYRAKLEKELYESSK